MRDPTTVKFQRVNQLMAQQNFTGKDRPVGRITVGRNSMVANISDRPGPWRSLLSGGPRQVELPGVLAISLNRSIGNDSDTCTITLRNDTIHPSLSRPEGLDRVGRKGYLTFDRGRPGAQRSSVYNSFLPQGAEPNEAFPTDWGYPEPRGLGETDSVPYDRVRTYEGGWGAEGPPDTVWLRGLLVPNRVVRTFQGYGSDNLNPMGEPYEYEDPEYVPPFDDTKLYQTGIWLIDQVTYNHDGSIEIQCRDLAKLLIEQIVYPPMIPMERFPLVFKPVATWQESQRGDNAATLGAPPDTYQSSNDPWVGQGQPVHGHYPADAFDGSLDSYWLSIGNGSPSADYSFEYITADTKGNVVNEISVTTKGNGYQMYVSVYEGGVWQGENTIPYNPNSGPAFPNGSNIPYVMSVGIPDESTQHVRLPRAYNAQYVRITFTHLWNSGLGTNPYRAGVREFNVQYSQQVTKTNTGEPGYISDWSEAIKELVGWAGFTWVAEAYDGETPLYPNIPPDPLLGMEFYDRPLRAWGDFEDLGAGPVEETPPEQFINKSFMEAINTIKDMLGCVFFVDESGGAIFRLPNMFGGGNFITDPTSTTLSPYLRRAWPIEFHENANLTSYSVTLDDSQVRSDILVVGGQPDINSETVAAGYELTYDPLDPAEEPNAIDFTNILGGQNRLMQVPGDATAGFKTVEECQRMAELIALQILYTYRKGNLNAPAHPGLQLDDQIVIYERVTNERNIHYVSGFSTNMDLRTGEYTMSATTHWLGSDPDTDWFLDKVGLTDWVKSLPAIEARLGGA